MRFCVVAAFVILAGLPAEAQPPRPKDKKVVGKVPTQADTGKLEKVDDPRVGGKTLSHWRGELSSEDASKRALAVVAIMQFGGEAKEAVPDIVKRLRDDDLSPRAKACMALRVMEIDGKDVAKVVKALGYQVRVDPQGAVRYEAALTLRRFGPDAADAIPDLIVGVKDPTSWEIRHMCIGTLWRVAQDPKNGPNEKAVEALVNRLNAERSSAVSQEKLEMVIGLGSLGRPKTTSLHVKVVDTLHKIAYSARVSRSLALWAYAGLVNVADEKLADDALLRIGRFLKHENIDIRVQAIGALGALGPRSKKRVPDLIGLLSDRDAVIVSAAASALAVITDNKDAKVIDALLSVMTQNEKDPGKAAAGVIGLVNLKANEKRVLAAMDKMRENKDLNIHLRNLIEQGKKTLTTPVKAKDKN